MIDYSILDGKKASFFTLGCKLNFAETSTLGEMLLSHGVKRAAKGEPADICIVNTCTVTAMADSKCRQAIHKIIKDNPEALVAVTGCYAQLQPQTLSDIPGVSLVVGAQHRSELIPQICYALASKDSHMGEMKGEEFFPSCSHGDRTRYFLKVQDGCNYYCTYCTIPMARGRSRNGSIASLVEQARRVAEQGGKEIVLTGVNIGDFGRSTKETFLDLIRELDKVDGIERYRISSIEPDLLTDDIIEFCARSERFMPHFHIPLQSGSDSILRLMHRHYDTALFRYKIERIKQLMPDCFIGVDVMTGTRGETPELFDEACRFIECLDISQLHVFTYSERPGTKALQIPYVVSPKEKHLRTQRLLELSEQKTHAFYERFIGKTAKVLLEHSSRLSKPMNGFTDNYIRIEIPNRPELDNQIVEVLLGGFNKTNDALCASLL
ncbi:MAG: tRNA (N(6)-L-threonylcarbamoyladenosine(37)-C(2))-methylthiotransferase MtaB [Bacteroidaceae bacterium]|jgi:threonylcarbamoyladenosine tRNA methylthiotransferase MtaB|nr:tRNA (N(6)-L-threonylcarbamoyladenosine(37)-C(2))-methylthiotransferase MtaB [Bacteroidaceae bacterium]